MSVSTLLETTSAAAGVVGPGQPTGRPSFTVSAMTLPSGVFQYSWLIRLLKSGTACWKEPVMYVVNFSLDMRQATSALASFCCLPSTGMPQFITKVKARLRPAGPLGVKLILPAMKASLFPEPDQDR